MIEGIRRDSHNIYDDFIAGAAANVFILGIWRQIALSDHMKAPIVEILKKGAQPLTDRDIIVGSVINASMMLASIVFATVVGKNISGRHITRAAPFGTISGMVSLLNAGYYGAPLSAIYGSLGAGIFTVLAGDWDRNMQQQE